MYFESVLEMAGLGFWFGLAEEMMQDFVELQAIFDWKFSILILQEMDEIEIQYKSTTAAAAASTKNLKDYNISTPLE